MNGIKFGYNQEEVFGLKAFTLAAIAFSLYFGFFFIDYFIEDILLDGEEINPAIVRLSPYIIGIYCPMWITQFIWERKLKKRLGLYLTHQINNPVQ